MKTKYPRAIGKASSAFARGQLYKRLIFQKVIQSPRSYGLTAKGLSLHPSGLAQVTK